MKGKSFVLNLVRRPDRLKRFQEFYEKFGPNLPLTVFNAIDGSNPDEFNRVPETIIKSLCETNDYNNKASIRATAAGHMFLWNKLLESEEEYSLIFEDDCYFRPDNNLLSEISSGSLKKRWSKIIEEYATLFTEQKKYSILWSRRYFTFTYSTPERDYTYSTRIKSCTKTTYG